ncbi:GAF domain-containing protein [Lacisediminihabitans profunda]|uniref:GAF domain-containing protein n=2 Tax=Lacisediminihabitans profunda TaxID=2594790 RepID=A0A5C8UNZ0_9MICO|nr:GAF domain-containing protein [Lacisediminihabitans profunda]
MPATGVRRLVEESWQRSLQLKLDPDRLGTALEFDDDELREYRDAHPMSLVLPTIHSLLIRHTFDSGLIVAVGDEAGRLLWIDGDRSLRRKAEGMLFVEGADWSERAVGTSAPGTALALDHGIQIQGAEHFNRIVHPWSCTAVPVHDPASGRVLGVIDITGGEDAVAPATLPLLEAAVAAVESELRIRRLDELSSRPRRATLRRPSAVAAEPLLAVLGSDTGRLTSRGKAVELSMRHAEILTLLAWHPEGLSVDRLAGLVYEREGSVVTLRAEMVRLRKVLEVADEALVPLSRPYRLPRKLELDAHRVLAFLDRGAHRVALAAYSGALLPTSSAPGIVAIRAELSARLRDALLTDASVDTLLSYARSDEAVYDVEVWRACLMMLPPKSPKRAAVVSRLERIEIELGAVQQVATSPQPRRS